MTDIFKKAGVLLIALIMVAATGGYTIYQHYCSCAAALNTSCVLDGQVCNILPADDRADRCCEQEVVQDNCCADDAMNDPDLIGNMVTVQANCCAGIEGPGGKNGPVNGCCYSSEVFLKIDDYINTTVEQVSFRLIIRVLDVFGGEELTSHGDHTLDKEIYDHGDPPPLLTGREKVFALQQVKIAPPLS